MKISLVEKNMSLLNAKMPVILLGRSLITGKAFLISYLLPQFRWNQLEKSFSSPLPSLSPWGLRSNIEKSDLMTMGGTHLFKLEELSFPFGELANQGLWNGASSLFGHYRENREKKPESSQNTNDTPINLISLMESRKGIFTQPLREASSLWLKETKEEIKKYFGHGFSLLKADIQEKPNLQFLIKNWFLLAGASSALGAAYFLSWVFKI